jgi:hypothetical protein
LQTTRSQGSHSKMAEWFHPVRPRPRAWVSRHDSPLTGRSCDDRPRALASQDLPV